MTLMLSAGSVSMAYFNVDVKKHVKILKKWVNDEGILNYFDLCHENIFILTEVKNSDNAHYTNIFNDTYNHFKKYWGLPIQMSLLECNEGMEMWGQVMLINSNNWITSSKEIEMRTAGDRLVFHAFARTINKIFQDTGISYIFNETYKD